MHILVLILTFSNYTVLSRKWIQKGHTQKTNTVLVLFNECKTQKLTGPSTSVTQRLLEHMSLPKF